MKKIKLIEILLMILIYNTFLYASDGLTGYFRTTMLFKFAHNSSLFEDMNLLSLQFESSISNNIDFHIEGFCYLVSNPNNPYYPATPLGCPNFNRFYFTFYPSSSVSILLGKNTIHWGVNQLLRTQDYFNPTPIVTFTEEEVGRYLLYTSYSFSNLSMEGVISPISNSRSEEGVQLSMLVGPLEFKTNFFQKEPTTHIIGLNWNFSLSPIVLYGEETFHIKQKQQQLSLGISFSIKDSIIYIEYLHNYYTTTNDNILNNNFTTNTPTTTIFPILSFTSKDYLGTTANISISPINQLQLYLIFDLDKKNYIEYFEYDHNITQNLTLSPGFIDITNSAQGVTKNNYYFLFQARYWF